MRKKPTTRRGNSKIRELKREHVGEMLSRGAASPELSGVLTSVANHLEQHQYAATKRLKARLKQPIG